METTSHLLRSLMLFSLLLVEGVQSQNSSVAEIVPTKLQIFQYDSISFDCEGFMFRIGLVVMRKIKDKVSECVSTWEANTRSICTIKPAYQTDSGRYWCQNSAGERSNIVNITITGGTVILESPVRPVVEGDTVSLRCRSKMTSFAHVADFYKDGIFIGSGSTGEISIQGVSRSHEGTYRCSISDFGESAQSWLAVRAAPVETLPPPELSCPTYPLLRSVSTLLMVALLLLLVGLVHFEKLKVTQKVVCVCKVCEGSCQRKQDQDGNDKEL